MATASRHQAAIEARLAELDKEIKAGEEKFSDARRNLEALQVEKSTLERILEAGKDKKGGGVIPPS
jgi:chromosome segregation ATPase